MNPQMAIQHVLFDLPTAATAQPTLEGEYRLRRETTQKQSSRRPAITRAP